jgi:hypothetical protein
MIMFGLEYDLINTASDIILVVYTTLRGEGAK